MLEAKPRSSIASPMRLSSAPHRCMLAHDWAPYAGYPFDIPSQGSSLLTYSVLSYHLPLLIAFSLQQHTAFVWGGFMLFRLQDMLTDKYRIMKVSPTLCALSWICSYEMALACSPYELQLAKPLVAGSGDPSLGRWP